MELETINKLYLELGQITTATSAKELRLFEALQKANDLCRSMKAIVERGGADTNWEAFSKCLVEGLCSQHVILHPEAHERLPSPK